MSAYFPLRCGAERTPRLVREMSAFLGESSAIAMPALAAPDVKRVSDDDRRWWLARFSGDEVVAMAEALYGGGSLEAVSAWPCSPPSPWNAKRAALRSGERRAHDSFGNYLNMRVWGLIAMVGALALATPAASAPGPALKLRSLQPFSVRGLHFKSLERVTVTLNGRWVRRVRTSSYGSFAVTFKDVMIGRCDGYRVKALGSKGTIVVLHPPPPMCAPSSPG
jgi:hypothetical protein